MQLLVSQAAFDRAGITLLEHTAGVDVITMDESGSFRRAGEIIDGKQVDPEVFWLSLDMYKTGNLRPFFGRILSGTKGKWVQTFSAGIDNPAFGQIMAKGMRLTKSNAAAAAIAEYVMVQSLTVLHPVEEERQLQRDHAWKYVDFREIGSTRWALVGFGAIGGEIAKRLKPFGAHLTVLRRNVAPEPLASEVCSTSELLQVIAESDVVVLACALNESTKGIAGQGFSQQSRKVRFSSI